MSARFDKLTDRQKDCLRLVLTGRSSKHIAEVLSISPATVDQHLKTACKLLEQNNRGVAARMLGEWERETLPQKLGNQSQPLAEVPSDAPAVVADEATDVKPALTLMVRDKSVAYHLGSPLPSRSFLSLLLPRIGGPPYDLKTGTRVMVIAVQVVILAIAFALFAGSVLGAAWYLALLNKHGG
jgi:DNA-binding CsgD family transcriptional regulator